MLTANGAVWLLAVRASVQGRQVRTEVEKNGSDNDLLDGQGCLFLLLLDLGRALGWWCCGCVRVLVVSSVLVWDCLPNMIAMKSGGVLRGRCDGDQAWRCCVRFDGGGDDIVCCRDAPGL